ncbi:hypothetical protein [Arthrobacter russicus]|uniref:Ribosomal protein L7/L12 C-terminal domain-containing protein n=1 Tax=Arthrobacter russicus TaxID=172040 RepID=A0ABU1JB89_9MICC|nr:hypothetical protein [Arthrobacter russicus]MBQ1443233.1 hypothetical protein [Renibacterium sp.]MDN5666917.1 hypothetical protein [Renibacterium salmoninarum]MDR6269692.1 hypothetical protein [Arthrobacter russicus]
MDWLIVVIIGIAGLAILIWALRVGRGKGAQLSDADVYLRGLTAKSHSSKVSAPQNLTSAQSTAAYTQAPAAQLPPHIHAQAQAMVRAGQKIQAIKLIRQSTGWDLATSKRFADNL